MRELGIFLTGAALVIVGLAIAGFALPAIVLSANCERFLEWLLLYVKRHLEAVRAARIAYRAAGSPINETRDPLQLADASRAYVRPSSVVVGYD